MEARSLPSGVGVAPPARGTEDFSTVTIGNLSRRVENSNTPDSYVEVRQPPDSSDQRKSSELDSETRGQHAPTVADEDRAMVAHTSLPLCYPVVSCSYLFRIRVYLNNRNTLAER